MAGGSALGKAPWPSLLRCPAGGGLSRTRRVACRPLAAARRTSTQPHALTPRPPPRSPPPRPASPSPLGGAGPPPACAPRPGRHHHTPPLIRKRPPSHTPFF